MTNPKIGTFHVSIQCPECKAQEHIHVKTDGQDGVILLHCTGCGFKANANRFDRALSTCCPACETVIVQDQKDTATTRALDGLIGLDNEIAGLTQGTMQSIIQCNIELAYKFEQAKVHARELEQDIGILKQNNKNLERYVNDFDTRLTKANVEIRQARDAVSNVIGQHITGKEEKVTLRDVATPELESKPITLADWIGQLCAMLASAEHKRKRYLDQMVKQENATRELEHDFVELHDMYTALHNTIAILKEQNAKQITMLEIQGNKYSTLKASFDELNQDHDDDIVDTLVKHLGLEQVNDIDNLADWLDAYIEACHQQEQELGNIRDTIIEAVNGDPDKMPSIPLSDWVLIIAKARDHVNSKLAQATSQIMALDSIIDLAATLGSSLVIGQPTDQSKDLLNSLLTVIFGQRQKLFTTDQVVAWCADSITQYRDLTGLSKLDQML